MKYNTDGFNERMNYILNSNDQNKLAKSGPSNVDNSFAKMRVDERKRLVETTNTDKTIIVDEHRGNKDSFIIRNNNINKVNQAFNKDNPVARALNKNMFKR